MFLKRLLLLSILLVPATAGTASIRISGSLSGGTVSLHAHLTNRVVVTFTAEPGEVFFTNDVRFIHTADPVYTGLTTISTRFSERFVYDQGILKERKLFLTYVFSPKYAGTIVLKTRPVHVVFGKKTNTVMTPVQKVNVYEPSSNVLVWVLVFLALIAGGTFWFLKRKGLIRSETKSIGGTNTDDKTENDGGSHVQ